MAVGSSFALAVARLLPVGSNFMIKPRRIPHLGKTAQVHLNQFFPRLSCRELVLSQRPTAKQSTTKSSSSCSPFNLKAGSRLGHLPDGDGWLINIVST